MIENAAERTNPEMQYAIELLALGYLFLYILHCKNKNKVLIALLPNNEYRTEIKVLALGSNNLLSKS
jgi:Tfp pilus assembly ATPase PilU